jgi:AAA family ATP:ADP antiporter
VADSNISALNRQMPAVERAGFVDRLLAPFAEVHGGEGVTALLFMFNMFLVLTAYSILKPVREALILSEGGAEIKSYAGAGMAFLLLFIIPAYSKFASQVRRIWLINGMTLFFMSNLVLFYVLALAKVPLGIIFFLWIGIFNLMITAQFWAFANDVYTEAQGRRLFAIVGFGQSLGAVLGAEIAGLLLKPLGVYQMMLVGAVILAVAMIICNTINQRERRRLSRAKTPGQPQPAEDPLGKTGGFQLVLKDRYLVLIALMMLVLNFVNTTGEFILGKTVSRLVKQSVAAGHTGGLSEGQMIGIFYADYQFWVNLIGALLQLFVVSRILKYVGVRGALFFLPVIALGSYSAIAFFPVLGLIRLGKILENSTDYSIQNTTRQALFLPTSREAKYKAKAAIDSFFWRAGDALSALLVFVGAKLAFNTHTFALANIFLTVVWILLVIGVARQHRRITSIPPAAQVAPVREV